jgi:flagellar capping protein FliD
MGSIQFLGLASGTDWNSIIEQLVQIESGPLNKLTDQRDKLEFDRSIMSAINQQFTSFDTKLSNLRFESTFLSRIIEASNSGRLSAIADAGAALGTYNVEISRLAAAGRAVSGLDDEIYSKVANLSGTQTMGIQSLVPFNDFQPTRALSSTLIKDTTQAGRSGATITAGDTITITGTLKDGATAVNATFTFAGNKTDTLANLATAVAQAFQGEIAASVGTNGELVLIETDPSVAGDVSFTPNTDLVFHDNDYSGSTLTFGVGNNVAGAGATARRHIHSVAFTSSGALETSDATDLATLDQVTGILNNGDVFRITGKEADGTSIAPSDFTYTGAAGGQTIAELVSVISVAFTTATASYANGRIVLTADATGATLTEIGLQFIDQGAATSFALGNFTLAEPGRLHSAQMVTTSSFTVEGTGEHLLSSTVGKAGKIRGTMTLIDPSNTLGSYAITEFDMLAIDPDGTASSLGPVTITGLSEYSTIQDLIDAINKQVPTVTAQLYDNGTSYYFELIANKGGQNIRVYDDANGILQILDGASYTSIDTAAPDPLSAAATTDSDDATLVSWFKPANGGPMQRRMWTGDEGAAVQDLIGGVAIMGAGGAFNAGVANVVTVNSGELNTRQNMYTYIFGSDAIVASPSAQYPPFDPSLSLAQAGFATTPQNASTNPVFHTDGFFTINGVRVNVGDVNTMTVNELLGRINVSGAGVTAYFDQANGRFYLRSNTSGPTNINLGGGGDTSNFLTIAGLRTDQGGVHIAGQRAGNIDNDLPLAQSGFTDTPGSGVFTINGVKITIDVGVDTLDDVIHKINSSGAGVIASYDSIADRLTLMQDINSGVSSNRIEVGDAADTSNFLEAVLLTVDTTVPTHIGTVRQTAQFSVNGVGYTRNSNSVDDVIGKVELRLNALTDGPETITITSDTDRIQDAIVDFIVEYNKTMELVNGKPVSRNERENMEVLTEEKANEMTLEDIEDYIARREGLLIRDFVSRDSSVRRMSRKIQNLVQGQVYNDGLFQSLSQLGLTTSQVGGGPDSAATTLGRLVTPTSDRETIKELLAANSDLMDAIRDNGDDLFTLFANMMESRLDHQGSRDLGSGITVSSQLSFILGNGTSSATISFAAGSHSQNSILNTINQQILNSGLSRSLFAYYDAKNQLVFRAAKTDGQAFLQLQDTSSGSDSLLGLLGLQPGIFFGPDPEISGGVARRTRSYIQDITGVDGIVMERIKQNGTFDRRISVYNDAIRAQEERLANYEDRLTKKFERMETALIQLQNQQSAIESAIATMNYQTSST